MKKILTILLVAVMLLTALPMNAFAFSVDPKVQVQHAEGGTSSYSSLTSAVNAAVDGDTVALAGEVSSLSVSGGVTVNKNITFKTGEDFNGNKKYLEYGYSGSPLFTVTGGGKLTLKDSKIILKNADTFDYGKLIIVEQGGTLVLDGTADEPLEFSGSCDGLIWVKDGGRVILGGATFDGEKCKNDIYTDDGGEVIADLTGDFIIDIRDLVRAKKHLASPETVQTEQSLDYNRDGNINAKDLILLKLYLLKSE